MPRFNFAIGTSGTSGMVNVESLPVPCLVGVWKFRTAQGSRRRGDWSIQEVGPSEAEWIQSIMTAAQRDQWRVFCPGPSAQVYIRTRVNDDRNYHNFLAEMEWPEMGEEDHQATRVLGVAFKFKVVEEIT